MVHAYYFSVPLLYSVSAAKQGSATHSGSSQLKIKIIRILLPWLIQTPILHVSLEPVKLTTVTILAIKV